MIDYPLRYLAETSEPASGLGAFNLNLKSFLFQLATFVIVLLVLRRWAFPKLISTIEERRQTLEKSLVQAHKTEEALVRAETKADEIIAKARANADEVVAGAKKAAAEVIAKGETAAGERAALIIKEAEDRLSSERQKLREELRRELANLVADATEKIIDEKLDKERDMNLIERSIKEVVR